MHPEPPRIHPSAPTPAAIPADARRLHPNTGSAATPVATAPSTALPRASARIAAACLVLAAAAAAAGWGLRAGGVAAADDDGEVPAIVWLERDGLRYEYHVLTGTESLWDLALPFEERDNLLDARRDAARRLRAILTRDLGLRDLGELRAGERESIERLKALGYL